METLAHLGPKVWALVPIKLKGGNSLTEFKNKIKQWKPDKCPSNLCRTYIGGVDTLIRNEQTFETYILKLYIYSHFTACMIFHTQF